MFLLGLIWYASFYFLKGWYPNLATFLRAYFDSIYLHWLPEPKLIVEDLHDTILTVVRNAIVVAIAEKITAEATIKYVVADLTPLIDLANW